MIKFQFGKKRAILESDLKILFDEQIFSTQKFGGVSRYYAELARALAQIEGVSAKILSPLCTNQHAIELSSGLVAGIRVPALRTTGNFAWYANKALSEAYLRVVRSDIFHQTFYPNSPHKARGGARLVTTVHDMIHELFPDSFVNADQVSERKLRSVQEAELVICVSENTKKDLIRITGIDESKTRVVHHGVDHVHVAEVTLNKPKDKPFLLYVGHRGGYKNFQRVLETYAGNLELANNFDLVCIGGGGFTADELELQRKMGLSGGGVVFKSGDDKVLTGLYQQATAFLCPSLYEGFGFPPLEAMRHGCPVISSNQSSLPEVLGEAAEYFDPYDSTDLGDAIEEVVGNPIRIEELRNAGLRQTRKYTWQACAEQTLAGYQSLF